MTINVLFADSGQDDKITAERITVHVSEQMGLDVITLYKDKD